MEITLFKKKFKSIVAWAVDEDDSIKGYVYFKLYFTRHTFFHFSVGVANKSFSGKNPLDCFLRALESESVGMAKYDVLKDRVRKIGCWNQL